MNNVTINDLMNQIALLTKRIDKIEKIITENIVNKSKHQPPFLPKNKVIEIIMDYLATYNIIVERVKDTEDDLVLTNVHGDKLRVSLRDTNSLFDNDYEFNALVSYRQQDIKCYGAFIFCIIDRQNKPQFLIFSQAQFLKLVQQKRALDGTYYFYFDKTWNGDYIDDHENHCIDISEYYDNWKALVIN